MQHVQEVCERNGKFDFDAFDGYDEMGSACIPSLFTFFTGIRR